MATPDGEDVAAAPLEAAPLDAAEPAPPDAGEAEPASPGDGGVVAKAADEDEEYGPFFEPDPPSDTSFATQPRKKGDRDGKAPVLSVRNGALCFVDGSHCKVSLLADATVAAGLRAPASNKGPDMPYAHFGFRGGFVLRPLMLARRTSSDEGRTRRFTDGWHPWGVGVVGSWTLGTGAVVVEATDDGLDKADTERTPAVRVGLVNQLWLSQRPHAMHLDFTLGGVRSPVLTSGVPLIGTHAEVAFGWGGWGAVYAAGDFLDQDTRVSFGFRGHAIAAGPLVALAILGAALGGAL